MNKKYVSFRIGRITNGKAVRSINHDMRIGWQPKYIKHDKSSLNSLVWGRNFDKNTFYELKKNQDKRVKEITKRKLQKNTERVFSGIFTFSETMKADYEINPELYKKCSIDFCKKLEEKFKTKILYAQNHLDETTPHIHLMFDNISETTGKAVRRKINPEMLGECQTLMAEAFKPMGYHRGEKNSTRKHLNVNDLHKINEMREELEKRLETVKQNGLKDIKEHNKLVSNLDILEKIQKGEEITNKQKLFIKISAPKLYKRLYELNAYEGEKLNEALEKQLKLEDMNHMASSKVREQELIIKKLKSENTELKKQSNNIARKKQSNKYM